MRNEHDGDDISYVKCLKSLQDQGISGGEATEHLSVLASVELGGGLRLTLGEDVLLLEEDKCEKLLGEELGECKWKNWETAREQTLWKHPYDTPT